MLFPQQKIQLVKLAGSIIKAFKTWNRGLDQLNRVLSFCSNLIYEEQKFNFMGQNYKHQTRTTTNPSQK